MSKVLLATGLYPPEIGGPATYARMLEEHLPQHGFSLTVVPYGEVRPLSKFVRHFVYTRKLYRAAKGVDVIYALDPVSVGLPAWIVSVLCRKPFMVRLGGDYAWEQGQQRFGLTANLDEYTKSPTRAPLAVRALATVQSFVVSRAKRVIVPSEYLKNIVRTWGVAEEKIQVIYSALFPLTIKDDQNTLRSQLSFSKFTLLSVGRLVPWKGFPALINVVAKLKSDGHDVSLVIAGDGPDEEKLQAHIASLNLEADVRLLGRLSKDALGATIKAADCFVLNTGYEGLSHLVLEVMDIGTPVVTTNVGGNPELVKDDQTGLLVDFNDETALSVAISRLMSDAALCERLVVTAQTQVHNFASEKVVLELATIIKENVTKP